ncbi:MAG: hypothetical protein NTW31_09465 [Bacteroidetes bacterium]|nr:hypothetical protein [Bacteroidota bacterium]
MHLFRTIVFTLVLPVFLISCGAPKNLIIGSWKCTDVHSENIKPAKLLTEDLTGNTKNSNPESDPMIQQILIYLPDFSKNIKFSADKTAVFNSQNRIINGNWVMNESEKTIVFTDTLTKNTILLKYLSVSKNRLEVLEHLPGVGDITIIYEKK